MREVKITIKFLLKSPIHSTGDRMDLWVDKAVTTDPLKKFREPVILASTIKGWLRDNTEYLLRGFGVDVCDISSICGKCIVCKIFGYPRKRSPLKFSNATFSDFYSHPRTSVALDRYTKTAKEGHLFDTEVVWSKELTLRIKGLFRNKEEAIESIVLIWLATKLGFAIGGGKSRGLGWIECKEFTATVDGGAIEVEKLQITDFITKWRKQNA